MLEAVQCEVVGSQIFAFISKTFLGLATFFSSATRVSRYQKGKTSLDLNETRDDGVWDAVASAGPYTNDLHLAPDR